MLRSRRPGVQVRAVAEALDLHPFMLSRWRILLRKPYVLFRSKADAFASIDRQREVMSVARLCALDGVTRAG